MLLSWLKGRAQRPGPKKQASHLRLEELETRDVPAIVIQLNYTYDNGFFANNPQARATLQEVATQMGDSISANLAAIAPTSGNSWNATFYNPLNGSETSLSNLSIAADTITIFVGARALSSSEAGFGGYGGYSISGSQAWISTVQTRGWTGFAPWGGSITFDTTQNWFFGQTTTGLTSNETDFYSVAEHEMGHVLGIGTSNQWKALSVNGTFQGADAMSVYGGPVPVTSDDAHWASGTTINGQHAVMDPILQMGQRVNWSTLDAAALRDIGWGPASPPAPPPPPVSTVPVGNKQSVVFTGSSNGTLSMFDLVNGVLTPTGQQFTPFVGYHGILRVAAGDFYGNGVTDYAVTTGGGTQAVVEILSGTDGSVLVPQTAVFAGFDGGLFLAAGDIDGTGRDQLAVSADAGAGPQIQTFAIVGNQLVLQASFFAFDNPAYRGGSRVAIGDINGDGFGDLVVVTGGQAEGRVAIYSGAELRYGVAARLTSDFIPFAGYFGGLSVAVGDMSGDGHADLALSPDSGGPAHVEVWSGAALSTGIYPSNLPVIASFYAFTPTDQSGARLAMSDLEGNGLDDLIVASGNPQNSAARVFTYADFQTGNLSAATSYPLGANTVAGLYAADEVFPATSSTSSNSGNTTTAATKQQADTIIPELNSGSKAGTHSYTASSNPALSGCTCPACLALARLLKEEAARSGTAPTVTVM